MQDIVRKADVLIEALPYIQRFRNEIIVIKIGGSCLENPEHAEGFLQDVTFMECVGMRPVLVHGGGKAISKAMAAAGIEPTFVAGHRVTCERTIDVVERVMKERVNPAIIEQLTAHGAAAEALHGDTILTVRRKRGKDPVTGQDVDWGFVGVPGEVDTLPIRAMLERNIIPVITPLGIGEDGRVHNVNADSAAAAVARALVARKLAFISDVPGLLGDPANPASVLSSVTMTQIDVLIRTGVIAGGMLPKVQSALDALHHGVRKVHMIDGRQTHSLLLEIFTDKGTGTEIIHDDN